MEIKKNPKNGRKFTPPERPSCEMESSSIGMVRSWVPVVRGRLESGCNWITVRRFTHAYLCVSVTFLESCANMCAQRWPTAHAIRGVLGFDLDECGYMPDSEPVAFPLLPFGFHNKYLLCVMPHAI
ncbi:hypothetical protein RUM43_006648 [Polyplax serrata]|uniref:Uncharacterized protein n=1 Tax=Polyplax serrata TaxID=468196 RepID=A0AAN8S5K9_POLSC